MSAAITTERLERHIQILSSVTREFADATSDLQRLLDLIAVRVAEHLGGYSMVFELEGDALRAVAIADLDPKVEAILKESLDPAYVVSNLPLAQKVLAGERVILPTFVYDDHKPRIGGALFDFIERMRVHTMMLLPMRVHDRSLGIIGVARYDPKTSEFDHHDVSLAESLAEHGALAVSNAYLLAEASRVAKAREEALRRLRVLADASRAFSAATSDLGKLLESISQHLCQQMGDVCAIRVVSEDGLWLETATVSAPPGVEDLTSDINAGGWQAVGHGVTGGSAATGQVTFVPLAKPEEIALKTEPLYRPFLERMGFTGLMSIPLLWRGQTVGVASLLRNTGVPYTEDDLHFVQSLSDHAALAIGNARSYAAERQARTMAENAGVALRDSESRFAKLGESGIVGIVVGSLEGKIIEVNDTIVKWLGYSREEILDPDFNWSEKVTAPEYHAIDQVAISQLERTGIGSLREKEYITKSGARLPVILGSARLDGGDVISFVLDLRERNEARASASELLEARRADATIRSLLESAPDAIVVVNGAGQITYINEQTEKLFGYARDELIGRELEMLLPYRFREAHPAKRDAFFEAAQSRPMSERRDLFGKRKNDTEFPVDVSLSPLETKDGLLVTASIRDMSTQRAAEDDLRRARDTAEVVSRELEAFSYSVAHDLRSPLRAINGYSDALNEDYGTSLPEEARGYLDRIRLAAERMGLLIDALLGLSRVARTEMRRTFINLSDIAHSIVDGFRSAEPLRKVEVLIAPDMKCRADAQLVRVALDNLLGNAWKFTSKTANGCIEFGRTETEHGWAYFVRDNGAGFDMQYAGKLFTPFQRLHSMSVFSGTGIGLATVQRVITRHGGRIWAEGVVNKGATFFFTLSGKP